MYVGVDEAGKGPVLGPMVAAAVRADPESLPADVDDSKRVAPDRRREIAAALRAADAVDVAVATVETSEIDAPDTDMNTLTVRGQARAVRGVARAGDRVVADAGDTSEARFARRLRGFVVDPERETVAPVADVAVDAAHGADESDPVVGAASIVAKVARDARVAAIDASYPAYDRVGSGYPSDPTTRAFLAAYVADHGDVPPHARRSWSTCADALAAAEQSGLDEF
ncbi:MULTISPECIES: ribonuclease HII [Haloferacaceae]|uniref:Ribonuclease n=1 Tax=Halorubrum glutamatedens TaxID=2707018 RepID=A0ABD5QML8_9EURY|nr:ribonuclease HII [Halobellus captivus]